MLPPRDTNDDEQMSIEHELAQLSFMREQARQAAARLKAVVDEGRLSDTVCSRMSLARIVNKTAEKTVAQAPMGLGAGAE